MNPAEEHTASGHSDSLDDKKNDYAGEESWTGKQMSKEENGCAGANSETGLGPLSYAA